MNIVVAIDSLKGSLTSLEAGVAIKQGIEKVYPNAGVTIRPLADGGEGTVEALTLGMGGRLENVLVTGPLGKPVNAVYGILEPLTSNDKKTAIIEMSAAAGITLVDEKDRNPLNTTTYGVGEIIKDAIFKGCRHFIVGIGGSATNDGGIGMLQALGYGFHNKNGMPVLFGANGLKELKSITDEEVIPELKECTFRIACDVNNTLCGALGCSAVFGPQKGATPTMIMRMDRWLSNYAALCKEKYPNADKDFPGTGAAGGLGVAEIAKKHNKKVLAFSGSVSEDSYLCNENGIDAFFPILRNIVTLQEAMDHNNAEKNMIATVEQVFRTIKTFS